MIVKESNHITVLFIQSDRRQSNLKPKKKNIDTMWDVPTLARKKVARKIYLKKGMSSIYGNLNNTRLFIIVGNEIFLSSILFIFVLRWFVRNWMLRLTRHRWRGTINVFCTPGNSSNLNYVISLNIIVKYETYCRLKYKKRLKKPQRLKDDIWRPNLRIQ